MATVNAGPLFIQPLTLGPECPRLHLEHLQHDRVPSRIFLLGVEVFAQCRCLRKDMGYKGRVSIMAVGRVLIAVTDIFNRYSAENLYAAYCRIKVCLPATSNQAEAG